MSAQPKIVPGTPEWKAARTKSIGASDAAASLGMNPWKSRAALALEKIQGTITEENEAMHQGHVLENPVALAYALRWEEELTPEEFLIHPTEPWMSATPDRGIAKSRRPDGTLAKRVQIKTSTNESGWGAEDTDQIPKHYLVQVVHEMAVSGAGVIDVAVVFARRDVFRLLCHMIEKGGMTQEAAASYILEMDFRRYIVHRDLEVEAQLIEAERKFWQDYVVKKLIPEIDGDEETRKYISMLYAKTTKEIRQASQSERNMIIQLQASGEALEKAKVLFDTHKNALCAQIGADLGLDCDLGRLVWRPVKGATRTSWKDVAMEYKPTEDVIGKHTFVASGYRRWEEKWAGDTEE